MKNVILTSTFLLFFSAITWAQERYLPVASDSEEAKELYHEALVASFEQYDIPAFFANIEKAIQLDENFLAGHFQLGVHAMVYGETEKGTQHLQKVAALSAEGKVERNMQAIAKAMLQEEDTDLSPLGDQMGKDFPNTSEALTMAGYMNYMEQDFETAIAWWKKSLDVDPDFTLAHNMMGYSYLQLGEMEKSKVHFNKYLAANKEQANPYDSMGDYYMTAKRFDRAAEYYQKALDIDSNLEQTSKKLQKAKSMQSSDSDQ